MLLTLPSTRKRPDTDVISREKSAEDAEATAAGTVVARLAAFTILLAVRNFDEFARAVCLAIWIAAAPTGLDLIDLMIDLAFLIVDFRGWLFFGFGCAT